MVPVFDAFGFDSPPLHGGHDRNDKKERNPINEEYTLSGLFLRLMSRRNGRRVACEGDIVNVSDKGNSINCFVMLSWLRQ